MLPPQKHLLNQVQYFSLMPFPQASLNFWIQFFPVTRCKAFFLQFEPADHAIKISAWLEALHRPPHFLRKVAELVCPTFDTQMVDKRVLSELFVQIRRLPKKREHGSLT
jgi:hypothetical protein